jgi:hypothetical protein
VSTTLGINTNDFFLNIVSSEDRMLMVSQFYRRAIYTSYKFTGGVVDTSEQFFGGVNGTSDEFKPFMIFLTNINNTGEK